MKGLKDAGASSVHTGGLNACESSGLEVDFDVADGLIILLFFIIVAFHRRCGRHQDPGQGHKRWQLPP